MSRQPEIKEYRSLLASLLIHIALVVAVLHFSSDPDRRESKVLSTVASADVPVSWVEVPTGKVTSFQKTGPRGRSLHSFSLWSSGNLWEHKDQTAGSENGQVNSGASTAEQILKSSQGKGSGVFRYIYSAIQRGLVFPSELHMAGFEGELDGSLVFDLQGNWLEAQSHLKSETAASRYFRVSVMKMLRALFLDPIPANLMKDYVAEMRAERPLHVAVHFVFKRRTSESTSGSAMGITSTMTGRGETDDGPSDDAWIERAEAQQTSISAGNRMRFSRVKLYRALAWKLGPIHGYGLAPGLGVDPEEVVDWFAKAFTKKRHHAPVDPLERYRQSPDFI